MLLVHLFNMAGYKVLFQHLMNSEDAVMVSRIDEGQYSRKGLTVIKTSFSIPYLASNDKFERVDGEVNIGGTYYRYVERKFYKDTLYLVCLPNPGKTELSHARAQFEHNVVSFPGGEKKVPGMEIKKGLFGGEACQLGRTHGIAVADHSSLMNAEWRRPEPALVFLPPVFSPPDLA